MTVVKRTLSALAGATMLGGCTLFSLESGYHSLTIRHHRFEPRVVNVPAGRPFMLTVDGFDDSDLAITAPKLGITMLRVPSTPEERSPMRQSRILPGRNARLPLGPLEPGSYVVSCACHGEPSEAVIIAR